jgi:predicted kinase
MLVKILSGIPGSGKSTYAKSIGAQSIFSADDWFNDTDGKYRFVADELPIAHAFCLRRYTRAVTDAATDQTHTIVVDNTNTTVAEIAPYYALADAFGHAVEIITLHVSPEVAAARNVHGVSLKTCQDMRHRIMTRNLPPWWKNTDI